MALPQSVAWTATLSLIGYYADHAIGEGGEVNLGAIRWVRQKHGQYAPDASPADWAGLVERVESAVNIARQSASESEAVIPHAAHPLLYGVGGERARYVYRVLVEVPSPTGVGVIKTAVDVYSDDPLSPDQAIALAIRAQSAGLAASPPTVPQDPTAPVMGPQGMLLMVGRSY